MRLLPPFFARVFVGRERVLGVVFLAGFWAAQAQGQAPTEGFASDAAPKKASVQASLETQRSARTWFFSIPPPRGIICDRNGLPLANVRVGAHLGLSFPRPLQWGDGQVLEYVRSEAAEISKVLGRSITVNAESALRHYRGRPLLPWICVQNLSPEEEGKIRAAKREGWLLQPYYVRNYPNGFLASHVLGYVGRMGGFREGAVENNESLWPDVEGRDGIEKTFDAQLRGESGQLNVTYNGEGMKASEQVSIRPMPGKHVVTTLDLELQRLCEKALASKAKRGAIVMMDPQTGDILAMASWPCYNPNRFEVEYNALNGNPNQPLIPRAFRAAYHPGSTFKCFVGLAGLSSGKLTPEEEYEGPPTFRIGNDEKKNWKKEHVGILNFAQALEQSCNTWFYQVGLKLGAEVIVDYANQLGMGERTGIPLPDEASGFIPTDEYMRRVKKERLNGGNLANLAIGQGDTEVTPLQMAQAMSVIANGGVLYQARLVRQIQDVTGEVVNGYPVRERRRIEIPPEAMGALRQGMVWVVNGSKGTAHAARLDKVTVAGKTGTAQWGKKPNERTAAWFAGFAPAEGPRVAFAALYEGEANDNDVHGGTNAAPMIGMVLREYFKDAEKAKPVKPRDAEGREIDLPMTPPVAVKAELAEPVAEKEEERVPAQPTKKVSFFKRLFGRAPKDLQVPTE
ncbi:MAG: penicillin-binding protein 2 [Verrucomicrobiota bacterium]|jgi:penicillin-binding protein 2